MILYDKNQSTAINCTDKRIAVLAGAGSGKTFCITQRILRIVKSENSNALVLTFTNSAAKELEYRLKDVELNDSFIGTFHSFCYYVLSCDKDVQNRLGYVNQPKILDEVEESSLLERVSFICSIKLPKKAYCSNYKPKHSEQFQFKLFHKQLRKELIKINAITFDVLCNDVSNLFKNNDKSVVKYFERFGHIFVDEFQDTDMTQWAFIESFERSSSIFLVGDVHQNIYQFRGCTNAILKDLIKDNNWTKIKLDRNFRSTNQICEFANLLNNHRNDEFGFTLRSDKMGQPVKTISEQDIYSILEASKFSNQTYAVICRLNNEVNSIYEKLNSKFKVSTKSTSHLDYVKAALDENYRYDYLLNLLDESRKFAFLQNTYRDRFEDKLVALEKMNQEFMESVYAVIDSDNFSELRLLYGRKSITFADLCESKYDDISNIYVGTIHSVKGLEFDNVIIYGQITNSDYSKEDTNNLMYVACTRAKYALYLCK